MCALVRLTDRAFGPAIVIQARDPEPGTEGHLDHTALFIVALGIIGIAGTIGAIGCCLRILGWI